MYDNFTKALEQFVKKEAFVDEEQGQTFEAICAKLKQEDVTLFEIACDLINWLDSTTQKLNENSLQFSFDEQMHFAERFHQLLSVHIPDAYFAVYAYAELEEYRKSLTRRLSSQDIDDCQRALLEENLVDAYIHIEKMIKDKSPVDRIGRVKVFAEEQALLDTMAMTVRLYRKTVDSSFVPVTAFFAQKAQALEARPASNQPQTVKLVA